MNITIKTHTTNSSHTHKTAVKYHTNVTQRVLRAHCEWGNSSVNGKKLLSKNSSLYHFEIWNREQITTPQKQNKKKLSILQQQEENILTFKWQKKCFSFLELCTVKAKNTHTVNGLPSCRVCENCVCVCATDRETARIIIIIKQ